MVIGLCVISLIAPLSASQSTDVPEWELGQTWSMGYEMDIGEMYDSAFDYSDDMIGYDESIASYDMSASGEMGFYQIFKITDVTEDEYVMSITAGGGIHSSYSFQTTMMMEKEGTYDWDEDWENIPKELKTFGSDIETHITVAMDGEARFEKDTLALKSMEFEISICMKYDLETKNMPDYDYDWEENTREVKYTDMEMKMDGKIDISLDIGFEPPLDLFDFPIHVGKEWTVESTMTLSGAYSGYFDATGLPEEMTEEMEKEGYSFPIILEELDIPGAELEDGLIPETKLPLSFDMKCTGTEDIELEDGKTSTVFLIQMFPDFSFDEGEEDEEAEGEEEYGRGYIHGYADGYLVGDMDRDGGEEFLYDYFHEVFDLYTTGYSDGHYNGYVDGYYSNEYDDSYTFAGGWDDDFQLNYVMKYSPHEGFIVSHGMSMGVMGMTPYASEMEMVPMTEDEATRKMEYMQQMPSERSFWEVFFSRPALIIMGVIIALVISIVFVAKKKGTKKTVYYPQPYDRQAQWQQQQLQRMYQYKDDPPPSVEEQPYSNDHYKS